MKQQMRKMLVLLMCFVFAFSVPVAAASTMVFKVTKNSVTIDAGQSADLTDYIIISSNYKSMTFKSSNTAIATVSFKGKVTGKKAGKTTVSLAVTYKNGTKKTSKFSITVLKPRTVYMVGDSRTEMMKGLVWGRPCEWYCKSGSGIWDKKYVKDTIKTLKKNCVNHSSIVLNFGVNDCATTAAVNQYVSAIDTLVKGLNGKDIRVICTAITPVRTKAQGGVDLDGATPAKVNAWNKALETQLKAMNKRNAGKTSVRAIYYNPVSKAGKMKTSDFKFVDALHYTKGTSVKLFNNLYNRALRG